MRNALVTLPFLFAATAAQATECTFTTECFDAEECSETAYALTLAHDGHGSPVIETVSGTLRVIAVSGDGEAHTAWVATGEGAIHLLTRATGGEARYTVHLTEGPMTISYLGACEAEED